MLIFHYQEMRVKLDLGDGAERLSDETANSLPI